MTARCSQAFGTLLEGGLGPGDVLVWPELADAPDAAVARLEAAGGTVVRWVLGKHDNG